MTYIYRPLSAIFFANVNLKAPMIDFFKIAQTMNRPTFPICLFLFVLLIPTLSFAQDDLTSRKRLTNVRGLGLANALVASATGTAAIWHNPATIAAAMMYAVDTTYRFQNNDSTHGFQVNLLDMKSNQYVGAQIGYIYEHSSVDGQSQHYNHIRLGLGIPLATDIVSIGVSGSYEHIKRDGEKFLSMGTMDVGVLIRPVKSLSLGITASNLFVGDYEAYMPRMISAGIAFNSLELGLNLMFETAFNLSAETIKDTGSFAVGVEYVLQKMFPIRVGYRYEMAGEMHVISAGLAFRDSGGRFGLDLAYQHLFEPSNNDLFQASFSAYF